jgi:hypothetical protein
MSASGIIPSVRHARLYECIFRAMRKKLSFDDGNSGRKKCRRGCGGAYGGVWPSLRVTEVWNQAVGFVFVRLAGIWLRSP